jgi:hypothetical protein
MLPLQIMVINAKISAERRDGNVGNNSAHCINSSARGRTPYMATQQRVGILSKQWHGGLVLLIVVVLLVMGRI